MAILAGWPMGASAQVSLSAGYRLAAQQCGACHAVDRRDQSPDPSAPRFRDLGARYPLDDLSEGLVEGMIVGHRVMPVVTLTQIETQDLIAYLKTLQGDRPIKMDRPGA
jgi:mono/diheme cytochrome c family protein